MSHYTSGDFFNIKPSYLIKEKMEEHMSSYTDRINKVIVALENAKTIASNEGLLGEATGDSDYTVEEIIDYAIEDIRNLSKKGGDV